MIPSISCHVLHDPFQKVRARMNWRNLCLPPDTVPVLLKDRFNYRWWWSDNHFNNQTMLWCDFSQFIIWPLVIGCYRPIIDNKIYDMTSWYKCRNRLFNNHCWLSLTYWVVSNHYPIIYLCDGTNVKTRSFNNQRVGQGYTHVQRVNLTTTHDTCIIHTHNKFNQITRS